MNPEEKSAAVDARKEYQREWRRRNKDKVRLYAERYWLKVAERMMTERDAANMEGQR